MLLSSLPDEVVLNMLTYLDVPDLLCVAEADPHYTLIVNKLIRQYPLKVDRRTSLFAYCHPSALTFSVPFLVQTGLDIGPHCDEYLDILAANGHQIAVEALLKKRAKVHRSPQEMWHPLRAAAREGYYTIVEMMLAHGAYANDVESAFLETMCHNNAELYNDKELVPQESDESKQSKEQWVTANAPGLTANPRTPSDYYRTAELLLNTGHVDLITQKGSVHPALQLAMTWPHPQEILQLLMDQKQRIQLDEYGDNKENIFHWMATRPEPCCDQLGDVVMFFLQQGVDVRSAAGNGATPLHYLSRTNWGSELAKIYLDHGADVNAKDAEGHTPLHYAVLKNEGDHLEVSKVLLTSQADIDVENNYHRTPLAEGLSKKGGCDIRLIQLLLQHGATVNPTSGFMPLNYAILNQVENRTEVIELLLTSGAVIGPDESGWTALHDAIEHVSLDQYYYSTKGGIGFREAPSEPDVEVEGLTPDDCARELARRERVQVMELLLKFGANVNAADKDGFTVVNQAIQWARDMRVDALEVLLAFQANVNTADANGRTPLHQVVETAAGEQVQVLNMLLRSGAHVNAVTRQGDTPLDLATRKQDQTIIDVLCVHGGVTGHPN